jgi:DNA-binding transcriptional MerR regulator
MNDIPLADTLLWEALPDLTLNIAQTAALCGISIRQLGYWTRQGYVEASGQGARRAYGLTAIRKVLAIRKAMEAGASLRQSLRQLSEGGVPPLVSPPPAPELAAPAALLLPPLDSAVSRSLAAFFAANTHTRDYVGGLAVKLGLAEDDVHRAAEALCASGLLACSVCQGMTVFYPSPKEIAHA